MSQIRIPALAFGLLLSLFVFALSGCGDKNPQAVFDPVTGKHIDPAWNLSHSTTATANATGCTACHGSDFSGGTARVACTDCHLGDAQHIHPLVWADVITGHSATVDTTGCGNANCHAANLLGVTGSGPSCTSCHIGDATHKHPAVGWSVSNFSIYSSHPAYVEANSDARCANAVCHGVNRDGAAPATAPSCSSCHLGNTGSGANITYSFHPATAGDWKVDHRGYILTGLNFVQTRAKCDIAACHGDPFDRTKPFNPSIRATVISNNGGCSIACHPL